ncbi:DUF4244 domain-containing protein [Streptomyces sp. B6B3]|uniref:DUF4244 domain-containing protein n=1 Tax=Streptomyces sp. B6B3 TaxID=3153570 RepID=UPI00325E2C94
MMCLILVTCVTHIARLARVVRRLRGRVRSDAGMSTAEYAVGTLAAAALAALLYEVLTSGAVSGALESLIERALSAEP